MIKVTTKIPETKKNQAITHIEFTHPKEIFVIDAVYQTILYQQHIDI